MNGYGRDLKIKEWWELINKWLNLIIIYTLKFLYNFFILFFRIISSVLNIIDVALIDHS